MNTNCCIKLNELLKTETGDILLLDIRNQSQYSQRHLPGSLNIPFAWLKENMQSINKTGLVVLIDESRQGKQNEATTLLQSNGIGNVKTLCGGVKAWSKEIQFF